MKNVAVIYFSGTGNTRYVARRIYEGLYNVNKMLISIEDDIPSLIEVDTIILLYPICGGGVPRIMREFIRYNEAIFWSKSLLTIVTEAGFSGDGGILAYNMMDKSKVVYMGSYHIIMPTNVSFGKVFRIKNGDAIKGRMAKVDKRIDGILGDIERGKCKKTGSRYISYLVGYHLQRKYFERIEPKLVTRFAVDSSTCIGCQHCVNICPTHNIVASNGVVHGQGKCTLCYRCLHACPTNSISIIRHEDVQYKGVDNGL